MIKELLEAMNLANRVRYAEVNSQSWFLTSERMAAENRDLRSKLELAERKVADSSARAERSARCAAREALIKVSTEKGDITEREMERIEAQVFDGWFEPNPSEATERRWCDREPCVHCEHRPAEREGRTRIEEKRPLPPNVLMGALQDVVHKDIGTTRPAMAIRVKRPGEREGSR